MEDIDTGLFVQLILERLENNAVRTTALKADLTALRGLIGQGEAHIVLYDGITRILEAHFEGEDDEES